MFLTRSQSQREKVRDDLNLKKEKDGRLERISISQKKKNITKTYQQRCASSAELCDVKQR